jgi:hypothetical protein
LSKDVLRRLATPRTLNSPQEFLESQKISLPLGCDGVGLQSFFSEFLILSDGKRRKTIFEFVDEAKELSFLDSTDGSD